MKLTSMKLSPKEAKEDMGLSGPSTKDKGPKYPYELRIRLDAETLAKLKLDVEDHQVGDRCRIEAIGEVIGVSLTERQGSKDREELEIQIVEIGIEDDKATKKAKADDRHLNEIASTRKPEAEE